MTSETAVVRLNQKLVKRAFGETFFFSRHDARNRYLFLLSSLDRIVITCAIYLDTPIKRVFFSQHVSPYDYPDAIDIFIALDNIHEVGHLEQLFQIQTGNIWKIWSRAEKAKSGIAEKDNITVNLIASSLLLSEEKKPADGLKWYELTENAHAILNDVIAGYSRLIIKEKQKEKPELEVLKEIETDRSLALKLFHDSHNFQSVSKMQQIIDTYRPIAAALKLSQTVFVWIKRRSSVGSNSNK